MGVAFLLFFGLSAIAMLVRIIQWARMDRPKGPFMTAALINLAFATSYSGFFTWQLCTYKQQYTDCGVPDFGDAILLLLWIFLFFAHVLVLWIIAEILMYARKGKNARENFYKTLF